MSDLKPCPFCGGKADYDWGSTTDIGGSLFQSGWACCTNSECCASIDIESVDGNISSADLIEKWNARATDRLEQENAELREAFVKLKAMAIQEREFRLEDCEEISAPEMRESLEMFGAKIDKLLNK